MPDYKGISYPLRTGMTVRFLKPIWKREDGKYRKVGETCIKGEIVHDSYGVLKGQHTFTILEDEKNKHKIKGRHLYKTAEILDIGCYKRSDT